MVAVRQFLCIPRVFAHIQERQTDFGNIAATRAAIEYAAVFSCHFDIVVAKESAVGQRICLAAFADNSLVTLLCAVGLNVFLNCYLVSQTILIKMIYVSVENRPTGLEFASDEIHRFAGLCVGSKSTVSRLSLVAAH